MHTALEPKSLSGWAEVTHPFHPRRHQRFKVLKVRRISGVNILSLQDLSGGTFTIAKDWTDLADPSSQVLADTLPTILHFESLLALADLVDELDPSRHKGEEGGLL